MTPLLFLAYIYWPLYRDAELQKGRPFVTIEEFLERNHVLNEHNAKVQAVADRFGVSHLQAYATIMEDFLPLHMSLFQTYLDEVLKCKA